ncbi:hypothetical protein AAY473_022470 [Plecturocebus cupreus]
MLLLLSNTTMWFSFCHPGWMECIGMIMTHCSLDLLGLSDLPASASRVGGTTTMCCHAWLIQIFFVDMGSCYVAQASLKFLASSYPPTSASQSAGIAGMSHHTWPAKSSKHLPTNQSACT